MPDHAKFDRKPEQPAHLLQRVLVGQGRADGAIMLQEIGKDGMGVHGNVAEDIVEDIRLGNVGERFPAPQPGGGGKLPGRQHGKERVGRKKAADGGSAPATSRPKPLIHIGQVGNQIGSEANLLKALQIFLASMCLDLGHPAAHQIRPGRMLLRGVGRPILLDQEGLSCPERC